jgi:diacylglycerol kinase (ATP)
MRSVTRSMPTKFIINPAANRGRTEERLAQIMDQVRHLETEFDVVQTEAPGQAIELARQAAGRGYKRIVAVGGDGTCNEVVNGLMMAAEDGHRAALAVIPSGSGNDFAYALGVPEDVDAAFLRLRHGSERMVDVGRVTVDERPRFFGNGVGLGLDAEAALEASQAKYFHGFLLYLWSVLKTVGFGNWPYDVKITLNETKYDQAVTFFAVGNGPRAGGGFFPTPGAKIDDGLFEVCLAQAVSKPKALHLLPKVVNGTHIHDKTIAISAASRIEFEAETGIPGHIDGEILCAAGRHFLFEIVPRALRVWT